MNLTQRRKERKEKREKIREKVKKNALQSRAFEMVFK
jgi:hypothetical protein